MRESRNGVSSFLWFLTGAAIGAGAALLYAPQSGADTRKKIKDASGRVVDDVKDQCDRISDEAKKSIDQVKVNAEKAMSNVKNFFEGAKDSLKKEIKEELEAAPGLKKK